MDVQNAFGLPELEEIFADEDAEAGEDAVGGGVFIF